MREEELVRLDVALLALRRLVEAPRGRAATLRHGDSRVELSTVLVVDAVARSEAGAGVGDVAATLHVAHSTASRLVDRAVRAGMVERVRHPEDPRRTLLSLTKSGAELQRAAVGFRTARLADILSGWRSADVSALADLLERFAHDAYDVPPPGGDEPSSSTTRGTS